MSGAGGEGQTAPSATPAGSPEARANAGAADRSVAQIRADIGLQQRELSSSMESLRRRVSELSDWRRQVREHRTELIAGAAIAGFVIGGVVAILRKR